MQSRLRSESREPENPTQVRIKIEALQEELQQLESRCAQLTNIRREHERRRDKLSKQLHTERKQQLALDKQAQDLDELLRQIENLHHQKQSIEQSIQDQLDKNSELETLLQAMREELSDRQSGNQDIRQRLRDMRRVGRDLASARDQHARMEDRMQVVLKDWEELQHAADSLRETMDITAGESRALADELLRHDTMIQETKRLRKSLEELEGEATITIAEQNSARAALKGLQDQVIALREVLNGLSAQTASLLPLKEELSREQERSRLLELRLQALEGPARADDPVTATVAQAEQQQKQVEMARRSTDNASVESKTAMQAPRRADEYYKSGIEHLDAGDLDSAIRAFKQALRYNKELAEAYYHLGIAYAKQSDFSRAGQHAYQAGLCYLKHNNRSQTLRMLLFIQTIDATSPYIGKLRAALAQTRPAD